MPMTNQRKDNAAEPWTHKLFTRFPNLYLPELLRVEPMAESEVNGIKRIFDDFKVGNRSRVLDFSCGIGRHSIRLSKLGYEVVGYDPSSFFLEKAKEKVKLENQELRIIFYEGAPGEVFSILSQKNLFDFKAIIIMYNSIGYGPLEEDILILRNLMRLASKEGTILITQTENKDWRIKNFRPLIIDDYGWLQIHEHWKYDLDTSIFEGNLKFYRKQGSELDLLLELPVSMRLYSLIELKQVLYNSGWNFEKSYGNIGTLDPFSPDCPELVTVSKN
jgi:SAM-dependent methyltransferase